MLNWLFGNNKKKKSSKKSHSKSSPTNTKAKTSAINRNNIAQTIDLPIEMKYLELKIIRKIMHSIIQTYKTLEYKDKKDSELNAKEWHSWQVGIMFKLYQSGDKVFIGKEDRKTIFPKNISESGEAAAQRVVENFAQKYSSKVNIQANKDTLSRDFSWTAREVGNLLYLITEE